MPRLWDCEKMKTYGQIQNGKFMINWPINGNDFYVNMVEMNDVQRQEAIKKAKEHTLNFVYFMQTELGWKTLGLADEFHERDKMGQRNFLHYGQSMMRETLLHRAGATEINRATGNELKFIQDFSKVMTTSKIEKTNQLLNEAGYHLERNGSAKMIFLDLSLQLSNVIK